VWDLGAGAAGGAHREVGLRERGEGGGFLEVGEGGG